ncbi:MAG: hypothetical protein KC493_05555 [Bacteriovoracaceae bacterium]|nr:hypothetical protein [Bacteriovoracaceae bacterium]
MNKKEQLLNEISEFSKETHGSTNYDKDDFFVVGESSDQYAPMKYLCKKLEWCNSIQDLLELSFVCDSLDLHPNDSFPKWYEHQFGKKLKRSVSKEINLLQVPDNMVIFDAIEMVNEAYQALRGHQILMNGKNLPTQLGEWYAKCVFGLHQKKSTSQRGFDFYLNDKRAEVKVHWADTSSPKGVKIRKSLAELSDYCIVIYIAKNFMLREICFLDSDFVIRKFAGKGHTIFLKDPDVAPYFFSNSNKHLDKVVNSSALLKYATPTWAMKIAEKFS